MTHTQILPMTKNPFRRNGRLCFGSILFILAPATAAATAMNWLESQGWPRGFVRNHRNDTAAIIFPEVAVPQADVG
ncbi:unnamed protein product, partial [marine sediment metagenome]